jgi:branched-chain amino acid transport system ATP-binding protein
MNTELLMVRSVVKRFGGFTALDGVDLNLKVGERLGLIGPNGSGKSTLVNCICGTLFNDEGSVKFEGHEVSREPAHKRIRRGLARSFQLPKPFSSMSVAENLCVPILYAANARPGTPHVTPAQAFEQSMEILKKVGLHHKGHEMSGGLTQVDMRKLELARAIAAKPKLLISDEAMAGLSNSEVDEILELLFAMKEQGIAVIMIEHIMRAVMRFSERVAVLVAGRKIADGNPEEVMRNPEVERAYLGE